MDAEIKPRVGPAKINFTRDLHFEESMKRKLPLMCRFGWHRPLAIGDLLFVDRVSRRSVFNATCPCGKHWMTDGLTRWFGFVVEKEI